MSEDRRGWRLAIPSGQRYRHGSDRLRRDSSRAESTTDHRVAFRSPRTSRPHERGATEITQPTKRPQQGARKRTPLSTGERQAFASTRAEGGSHFTGRTARRLRERGRARRSRLSEQRLSKALLDPSPPVPSPNNQEEEPGREETTPPHRSFLSRRELAGACQGRGRPHLHEWQRPSIATRRRERRASFATRTSGSVIASERHDEATFPATPKVRAPARRCSTRRAP